MTLWLRRFLTGLPPHMQRLNCTLVQTLTWLPCWRRFLTGLPPHMQHLNYTLVQTLVPVGLQSVEEIETIVHQATRPTVWANWPPSVK